MFSPSYKFVAHAMARRANKLNASRHKNNKDQYYNEDNHQSKAVLGPLNVIRKEEYYATKSKGNRQLFLFMNDADYNYCLYRFCEPEKGEDESTILKLDKPLQKMGSTYPRYMAFVRVGTSIYMVGGFYDDDDDDGENSTHLTNKTFVYDTLSNTIKLGPTLVSPKCRPSLLTIGSKIFALSSHIRCFDRNYDCTLDSPPWFEVLDTNDLERGWSALSFPKLYISEKKRINSVLACAAAFLGGSPLSAIFISVEDAGTYAYDVDKDKWKYVSDDMLPFSGNAVSMPPSLDLPCAPPLCYAFSNNSEMFCAYRFRYYVNEADKNSFVFQVDELDIDNSPLLSPPLPPEIHHESTLFAVDPIGRVYILTQGIDRSHGLESYDANCYVKVVVCEIEPKKEQMSKSCKIKNNEEGEMEHGAEQVETAELNSSKKLVLKRCSEKKRQMGNGEEGDDSGALKLKGKSLKSRSKKKRRMTDDREVKFKMTQIWRRSFFGGEMAVDYDHVCAAIAM